MVTCWAKSKPGSSHPLRLLLHPLDREGPRVQPIVYVGSGFLAQTVECLVPRGSRPSIDDSAIVSEAAPYHLATLSDEPATVIHLIFLAKSSIKVARNHIWRPKPHGASLLSEPFRSALQGGRAGRLSH
jgi:hypothetical protein